MTDNLENATIVSKTTTDKMAQRTQLQVDSRVPITRLILSSIASDESMRQGRKVTVREIVYLALSEAWGEKYPDLAKAIEEELN